MKSKAQRFLNPTDIETAINEMKTMSGDRFIVAGGVAMMFYGSERFTRDVDFVAHCIAKIPTMILKQKPIAYGGVSGITPRGVPVHFILRRGDFTALYNDAVDNPRKSDDGYYVATPEHLAIMKMVAGRSKDMSDLNFLVTSNDFDLFKAQNLAKVFLGTYGLNVFNSLVEEAEWRAKKDKR